MRRSVLHVLVLSLLGPSLLASAPVAAQQPPLTLAQVMADPDWIGPPVEDFWWRWDGRLAQYELKREGASIRDAWQVAVDGSAPPAQVEDVERAGLDASSPVYDPQRTRMAYIRNGDVFVRDLRSGALDQLTRSNADEALPQWGSDGALSWRVGNDWFRWTARGGMVQAASAVAEDAPGTPPEADELRERQLRLIDTLRDDRARREAAREQREAWQAADPTRAPAPAYLGKDVAIEETVMSPDGRWLLVVTKAKDADPGKGTRMPRYVTESGYQEAEDTRTLVGRDAPVPHKLWLVGVGTGDVRELSFDALPGIAIDPLADLRKAAGKDPLEGNRALRVETDADGDGPAIHWTADSRDVAVLLRAIDNKDRWIATVDTASGTLASRHRLHDPAWINWGFNDFGWLVGAAEAATRNALWYLSEESGYSHLYAVDAKGGKARALTSGNWEVSQPLPRADGGFLFVCNHASPIDYEVCAVDARGGAVREITALDGVEGFALSPDGSKLLVRHSAAFLPPQLSVVASSGGQARQLTDTRSLAFKAVDWIQPESVQVPSKHGAGTLWGKYYGPANPEPGRKYPMVMFVHGAGYLQNADLHWPEYFREQMFHNMLVQQGYIVLDIDYRGSEGYGRDWRTAIYRNMGHPELEDYLDGLDWAVANRQADRDHVGIYGGSYGGFMTFMALFREPGVFKAGAALRPVADWALYNHEYTSNILNTPDIDPEAYRRSSPIEYAAGLQDHLLIAHGMIDDNVFFQDSVLMTQKLIELRKHDWWVAPYPLERHGFSHADAWYDEYRRIHELFESTLK
ncbi:MAG: prolyl oligopeptidase family serine peptidase [Pseudomonadota bacterium]|nr:prolyl oligopeptidase family serine peptidase [Pseudomonadota bacterium]